MSAADRFTAEQLARLSDPVEALAAPQEPRLIGAPKRDALEGLTRFARALGLDVAEEMTSVRELSPYIGDQAHERATELERWYTAAAEMAEDRPDARARLTACADIFKHAAAICEPIRTVIPADVAAGATLPWELLSVATEALIAAGYDRCAKDLVPTFGGVAQTIRVLVDDDDGGAPDALDRAALAALGRLLVALAEATVPAPGGAG